MSPPEPVPPPGGWRRPTCTFESHLWELEVEDSRASLVCVDPCDMRLFDPAQPTPVCLAEHGYYLEVRPA